MSLSCCLPAQPQVAHDGPWTTLAAARHARKLGLEPVALHTLAKLYAVPAMELADAFGLVREQVALCHAQVSVMWFTPRCVINCR